MRQWERFLAAGLCAALLTAGAAAQDAGLHRPLRLTPGQDNPRNSEGAFVQLKDGRVMFVYTHFTGGAAAITPRPTWRRDSPPTAARPGPRET